MGANCETRPTSSEGRPDHIRRQSERPVAGKLGCGRTVLSVAKGEVRPEIILASMHGERQWANPAVL